MTPLAIVNFLVFQWFGLRLAWVIWPCGKKTWTLLRWVWPLTGWWSKYRCIIHKWKHWTENDSSAHRTTAWRVCKRCGREEYFDDYYAWVPKEWMQ